MAKRKKEPVIVDNFSEQRRDNTIGAILMILLGIMIIITFITVDRMADLNSRLDESRMQSDPTIIEYGDYTFKMNGEVWTTTLISDDAELIASFNYHPEELEDVNYTNLYGDLDFFINSRIEGFPMVITFNPNGKYLPHVTLSSVELGQHMPILTGVEARMACSEPGEGCEDVPIINGCLDPATKIFVREHPQTGVFLKKNCVIVQGEGEEILKATERLIYAMYGIMPAPRFTDWDSLIPQEFVDV